MDKYVNDRNNHEKIEPFDWNLDLEMNEDWAIWENEISTGAILKAKANVIKKNKKQKGE
jgi:hypothetical protein